MKWSGPNIQKAGKGSFLSSAGSLTFQQSLCKLAHKSDHTVYAGNLILDDPVFTHHNGDRRYSSVGICDQCRDLLSGSKAGLLHLRL